MSGAVRRINLLPREVGKKQDSRRTGVYVVLGLAAGAGSLFGFHTWQQNQVAALQAQVDAQVAANATLRAELADPELLAAEEIATTYAERRAAVEAALAIDVDWPAMLTDLAKLTPSDVWLTSFTAQSDTTNPTAPGLLNVAGESFSFPGAAGWLVTMRDKLESLTAAWLPSITRADAGGETLEDGTMAPVQVQVTWSSTAALTPAALSSRAVERIPPDPLGGTTFAAPSPPPATTDTTVPGTTTDTAVPGLPPATEPEGATE